MPSATQHAGKQRERWVQSWLQARGLSMLARNVRWRGGEIDLILQDGADCVFVEVRYRAQLQWGGAAASVSLAKRRRVLRTAQWWLSRRFPQGEWPRCRFDVVAIDGVHIEWLRDAFAL